MIPLTEVAERRRVPSGLTLPELKEVDPEQGLGGSESTWLIHGVSQAEAQALIEHERRLIEAVDEITTSGEQFEALVGWIEHGDTDDATELGPLARRLDRLDGLLFYGGSLEGLDLGVAGLVYALNAAGAITARSHRGHVDHPWVTFACGQPLANVLLDRCMAADVCIDGLPRSTLLQVWAPTIRHMNVLAGLLVPRAA